jgi:hypothetical protein
MREISNFPIGRFGFRVICVTLLFSTLASRPAKAAFVIENDSVFGVSSVVLDTRTGLYWLKPKDTLGLSYSAVQTDIADGGTGHFVYASYSQVKTLFADAGITDFTDDVSPGSYAGASAIISAFGQTSGGTLTNGSYHDRYEQVAGVYAENYDAFTIAYQMSATGEFGCTNLLCAETSVGGSSGGSAGPYGSWLVATALDSGNTAPPVPLPASAWLMLSGIGVLVVFGRRRGLRLGITPSSAAGHEAMVPSPDEEGREQPNRDRGTWQIPAAGRSIRTERDARYHVSGTHAACVVSRHGERARLLRRRAVRLGRQWRDDRIRYP